MAHVRIETDDASFTLLRDDSATPTEMSGMSGESVDEIKEDLQLMFFQDYFSDLEDEEFITTCLSVIEEYEHMSMENEIFVLYLQDNEPAMLSTFPEAQRKVAELEDANPLLPLIFDMPEEVITADSMPFTAGPKVNISQRTDLVARYVDELNEDKRQFLIKANSLRKRYRSENEESAIRMEEWRNALLAFEMNVVINGVDPITQRIPAEKWVAYIHDWMKSARFLTERLRLNISYMKVTYNKLKTLYDQKRELGVSLCDIDFEGLRIENAHLRELIEQKNMHVVELKRMSGSASLELATHKKMLLTLDLCYNSLLKEIADREHETAMFMSEITRTKKELYSAKQTYEKVKDIVDHCKAPETLTYLHVKHQYTHLVKENKIISRQENILAITRRTFELNMMRLTHRKTIDPNWYLPLNMDQDEEDIMLPTTQTGSTTAEEIDSEFDIFKAINVKPAASNSSMKRDIK